MSSLEERFNSKVQKTDGCWYWTATKDLHGYGRITYKRKSIKAHRLAIILEGSDIPSGMCVLHTCDNPSCVRPNHLWIGSHDDNMRDMANKGRARVPKGEQHHKAKLTMSNVKDIRNSEESGLVLAKRYGVAASTIYRVRRGESWNL